MSLINYKDIDFNKSINKETIKINFNDYEIEIVPYLSINDKYNLIMTTLSRSDEIDLYNSFKTKFYFDLHLVLMYSNIVFTEEDKQDELKLYDTLKQSGLMDVIIEAIPKKERESLWGDILMAQNNMMEYRRSTSALINTVFEKGPGLIGKAKEMLSLLDENKVKMIMDIVSKNIPIKD